MSASNHPTDLVALADDGGNSVRVTGTPLPGMRLLAKGVVDAPVPSHQSATS